MARSTTSRSHVAAGNGKTKPEVRYDAELFELWINGKLVKRLDGRAINQGLILAAFQEMKWCARIDDPLIPKNGADGKARLRLAIHRLNHRQNPTLIRFSTDGTGHGVRWEFVPTGAVTKRPAIR
jgi:hypothetical protein